MITLPHGKCPKCAETVAQCTYYPVVIGDKAFGPFFHGISMCCSKCKTVLGVSADPVSMAQDVADLVVAKIQGTTR